ncbi:tetratricopeptide repeat protein [Ottowia sp. GY511]|uniref:SirB1 family protein n=1 Tax=Ottowia flava TaxID=2675430 RepID=A0ABW4KSA1_9BURK|nr:transglutaminase-like domain-containing protein [Ottowia sp. GY511]TXK33511.1 tetratricopeptide repeat protein [Ottowia sp. GY511]
MPLDLTLPTPLAYFSALVQQDESLPLLEAAASLAQDETPDLDVQQVLDQVDRLIARLRRRMTPDADPVERLRAVNQLFFSDLGFAGNVNDYYNPDNSYLDVVLHTRRGIPISLAVLWLELAQSVGLQVEGVGFPGHFLVQAQIEDGRVVIDPFSGQSLGRPELRERLEQFHLDPELAQSDATLSKFLRPTPPRQILARMLRNLQDIHRTQQDWARLVLVQDRLVTLLPAAWPEYRERGLALAELGDVERARADLSVYVREAVEAADHDAMAERLSALGGSGG